MSPTEAKRKLMTYASISGLSGLLEGMEVDTLICGGIGYGAKMALAEAGIELYGGVTGLADDAVKAFLTGNLEETQKRGMATKNE